MSIPSPYITKTDFLNHLTCPGYAWHVRHRPDLLPKYDDASLRRMRDGQAVEALARDLFPTGHSIPGGNMQEAARRTRAAIDSGHTTLFQATAVAESGLIARADVLIRQQNGWHLVEVKSSSTDPEKPKDAIRKHLNDLTFQTIAFRQAGFPITQTSLMVLNRGFRMNGSINPRELFTMVDVSAEVAKAELTVTPNIEDAVRSLLTSRTPARCECDRKTRANRCDLFSYFHPDIPERDTIYNIASIQRKSLLPAIDRGILHITDWPSDIELSVKQKRQIEIARSGKPHVNIDKLLTFLASLETPLWYLDYETFQGPIPRWEGYAPHQQIAFQYSLHIDHGSGEIEHREFLADSAEADPTLPLLEQLSQDLGDLGTVVVWNKSFELGRNREMADRYPQYAEFLHNINERMIDLGDAVKFGWWEHPEFQGSWSLKQVLPVAAPDLSYKSLAIGDGGTASEQWMQAVLDSPSVLSDTDRANILESLRIYCAQDTLAMVRIHRYMQALL